MTQLLYTNTRITKGQTTETPFPESRVNLTPVMSLAKELYDVS
jgi:hypothetical protein